MASCLFPFLFILSNLLRNHNGQKTQENLRVCNRFLLFLKRNVFYKKRGFVTKHVNVVVICLLSLESLKKYKEIHSHFSKAIIFDILLFSILMNINKSSKRIQQWSSIRINPFQMFCQISVLKIDREIPAPEPRP